MQSIFPGESGGIPDELLKQRFPWLGGIFSPQPQQDRFQQWLGDPRTQLGAAILAGSSAPGSAFSGIGRGIAGVGQMQRQQADDELRRELLNAQIERARNPERGQPKIIIGPDGKPVYSSDVEGKAPYLDGSESGTADIQNWRFYQSLTPEQQKEWKSLQRQPTVPQVVSINGVPTLVDRLSGTVSPLTSVGQEASAQGEIARGKAAGQATGEAEGALKKKGVNATTVLGMLDIADPLIDAATGSLVGAGRDKLASVFGLAPEGAQAIAQLKVLQAGLMLNMPRMEGPQSDRDTQLYREAAGQIGSETTPASIKKAALATIRRLQNQYMDGGTGVRSQDLQIQPPPSIDNLLNKYAPR